MSRYSLALTLRRAKLLNVAYRIAMLVDAVRHLPANRRFDREHPSMTMPPAKLLFETQTTTRHETYWVGGRERARFVLRMVDEHLPPGPVRICDWGCGPGRIIRHLPSLDLQRPVEAFGTDYSAKIIRWCTDSIPDVRFRVNALKPPLPFGDDSFDCLYSFSVFTHLPPELQRQWLTENLRVVRPGGIVLFTVHGDSYRGRLVVTERSKYDATGIVTRAGVAEGGPWYTTYQRPEQVERELIDGLEIAYRETYADTRHPLQDVWVVRKSARA